MPYVPVPPGLIAGFLSGVDLVDQLVHEWTTC